MELEGLDRAARADPGGRVQAQGLVEDRLQVGQAVAHQLVGRGQSAGELGVLLGEQARDDVGVAGELVEHEGDGRGGGVVAGEQQGHDLVADLQIGERGSPSSSVASISRERTSSPRSPVARRREISE